MFLCVDNWWYSVLVYIFIILLICKIFAKFTLGISKSNTCLIGKTVLITGGYSGLGYQTALSLAGRGAKVIIADVVDATESVKKIIDATNNRNVVYKYLDLASLNSVRQFAKEINAEENRLDILVNNAGIGGTGEKYTEDGLHLTLQINYYGAFLLTHLLIGLLKKSAPSRIVFVSSFAAFQNNLTLQNLNTGATKRSPLLNDYVTYGNSKLLIIIAANIFAEKLRKSKVTANSVHPGTVATPIFSKLRTSPILSTFKFIVYKILLPIYGKTIWEGAQTQIECCLSKDLEDVTGKFFIDCKDFRQPAKTKDLEFCKKVWEISENLVKLTEAEKASLTTT